MTSSVKFGVVFAALMVTCAACSESRNATDRVEPDLADSLLEIPVEPVTAIDGIVFPNAPIEAGQAVELRTAVLKMAIGDDYPDAVTFSPSLAAGCGPAIDELTIEDVTTTGRSVEVSKEGDSLALRIVSPGETVASVVGTFEPTEELLSCWELAEDVTELPFELRLEVNATTIAGAALVSCVQDPHIAMELGAKIDAKVLPTDSEGKTFEPSNAAPFRAVAIQVTGDVDSLEVAEGAEGQPLSIRNVFLPPTETSLYLHTPHSEPFRIDSVAREQVTDPNVSFIATQSFDRLVLEDGSTYDETQLEGSKDRIFPLATVPARVGQTSYCSPLAPEIFSLETSTPDVCEAESVEWTNYKGFKLLDFWSEYIGHAVHVKSDGLCAMRLSASTLAGGTGWSQELEATFVGTENLESMLDGPTR